MKKRIDEARQALQDALANGTKEQIKDKMEALSKVLYDMSAGSTNSGDGSDYPVGR